MSKMQKKYLIVNSHLIAAALWHAAMNGKTSQKVIADALNISESGVQFILSGKTLLRVDRLYLICKTIGVKEQAIYDKRDKTLEAIRRDLGHAELIAEFPRSLGKSETVLRTLAICDRLEGLGWDEILSPDSFSSDDMLRCRTAANWSRAQVAEKFNVTPNTVFNWERAGFPYHRDEEARSIFSSVLSPSKKRTVLDAGLRLASSNGG